MYDNLNSWLGSEGHTAIHTLYTHLGGGGWIYEILHAGASEEGRGGLDRLSSYANMEKLYDRYYFVLIHKQTRYIQQ